MQEAVNRLSAGSDAAFALFMCYSKDVQAGPDACALLKNLDINSAGSPDKASALPATPCGHRPLRSGALRRSGLAPLGSP